MHVYFFFLENITVSWVSVSLLYYNPCRNKEKIQNEIPDVFNFHRRPLIWINFMADLSQTGAVKVYLFNSKNGLILVIVVVNNKCKI